MAISTTEPITKYPPPPPPWDPTCPACLSGFGPIDPNDPVKVISEEPVERA